MIHEDGTHVKLCVSYFIRIFIRMQITSLISCETMINQLKLGYKIPYGTRRGIDILLIL